MSVRVKLARCASAFGILLVLLVVPFSAFADVGSGSCANEALVGFSSTLPDCGAWELATPVFKDGGAALFLDSISGDGTEVLSFSLGGYAGTQADPTRALYLSARSGSGWATGAVSPPAARFPAQEFFAGSTDLTRTLWAMREPSQPVAAEDFYIRESDGTLVKVGPAVPPNVAVGPPAANYENFALPVIRAGASADLSHVLFQIKSSRAPWEGDTTTNNSHSQGLYEYVGTGNERPRLLGLNSEGHLISNCGTILGAITGAEGYQADMYNAISNTGETVFFTAQENVGCEGPTPAVNEVYASTDQSPGEPTAISEPTFLDCEECQTGTASVNHPAVAESRAEFQGASRDGSKAFFLTAQELFVGATGVNLYGYDFNSPAGEKIIRVSTGSEVPGVLGVARVSEDGSHVYFVAGGVLTGANREGALPVAEGRNLYVFERDGTFRSGHLAFVGALAEGDAVDWQREDQRPVQATPDGRFLVFQSQADLTVGDTSSEQQVFEYDAVSEELVRVSVGEPGYAAGAEAADANSSTIPQQQFVSVAKPTAAATALAVSAGGGEVVFSSRAGLTLSAVTAAAAGATSIYEYRSSGSIANGSVHLVSDGASVFSASVRGIGASGDDVFFKTAEPLLSGDGDTQFDVYDARSHGGFVAATPGIDCGVKGSCQGLPGVAPSFAFTGSVSQAAGGNAVPRSPVPPLSRAQKLSRALYSCRLRSRRKRPRCVRQARRKYGANVKRKGKG